MYYFNFWSKHILVFLIKDENFFAVDTNRAILKTRNYRWKNCDVENISLCIFSSLLSTTS